MSRQNGRLITCDRCGATTFCITTGEGEMDGGFTRWNKFADPPPGWGYSSEINMDLCPKCYAEYNRMLNDYKEALRGFAEAPDETC